MRLFSSLISTCSCRAHLLSRLTVRVIRGTSDIATLGETCCGLVLNSVHDKDAIAILLMDTVWIATRSFRAIPRQRIRGVSFAPIAKARLLAAVSWGIGRRPNPLADAVNECRTLRKIELRSHSARFYASLGTRDARWVAKQRGRGEVENAARIPLLHTPDDGGYLNSAITALH
jgi:hypothetical protein